MGVAALKAGVKLRRFVNESLPQLRSEAFLKNNNMTDHQDGFFPGNNVPQAVNFGNIHFRSLSHFKTGYSAISDLPSDIKEVMPQYFLRYLNEHTDEILLGMSKLMLEDADYFKEDAQALIDAEYKEMKKIVEEGYGRK